jgi:hypothetical protein
MLFHRDIGGHLIWIVERDSNGAKAICPPYEGRIVVDVLTAIRRSYARQWPERIPVSA